MKIIEDIHRAFSDMEPPFRIVDSEEGEEPHELSKAFKHKPEWKSMEPHFIDSVPNGLSSSLSFFGIEAFHYYIPAYIVADLNNQLESVNVVFHLTHGLDNESKDEKINELRYGERTWFNFKQDYFSPFSKDQVQCLIDYLELRLKESEYEFERNSIQEALDNYWIQRRKKLA